VQRVIDEIRRLAVEHNVFRGHVIEFGGEVFGHGRSTLLQFLDRPHMGREQVILPPEVLDGIERQVLGVARHAGRLLASGQHLKRGVLLHGHPGTGKTHTIRYLLGELSGTTVVLLSGGTRTWRPRSTSCSTPGTSSPGCCWAGGPGQGQGLRRTGLIRCSMRAAVTSPGWETLARCAPPRITRRREQLTPEAMVAACQGGVAGSSAPAMTSTGADIRGRQDRRSSAAIASQQPAYPCGSTRSSVVTNPATVAGSRSPKAGVNQRPTTCLDIDAMPAARACAARRVQKPAGGRQADVQQSPSASIRSGACAASHIPIIPPSEMPQ
jgi:hypothetical protein